MTDRIYDERHDYDPEHVIHVEKTTDTNQLRLIVIEGEQSATVQLSLAGAKALRLALQRWERSQA